MNLYFLVEGKRTEKKVYPAWLAHLVPKLRRVDFPEEIEDQSYVIFSGEGYPSLLDVHLGNAVKDYLASGKFNRMVVCLDVDDSTAADRVQAVVDRAFRFGFPINELRVIPQDCCLETWFLGNRRVVSPVPQLRELVDFLRFYNVRLEDPELMGSPEEFAARSVFHSRYFHLVAQDKRFRYTKHRPQHVVDRPFLDELIARHVETNHLTSLGAFLALCDEVRSHCP